MIPMASGVRVWIATGHTDMRRGMNSLALTVQEALKRDPHGGDLYVFCGKSGKLIKILGTTVSACRCMSSVWSVAALCGRQLRTVRCVTTSRLMGVPVFLSSQQMRHVRPKPPCVLFLVLETRAHVANPGAHGRAGSELFQQSGSFENGVGEITRRYALLSNAPFSDHYRSYAIARIGTSKSSTSKLSRSIARLFTSRVLTVMSETLKCCAASWMASSPKSPPSIVSSSSKGHKNSPAKARCSFCR